MESRNPEATIISHQEVYAGKIVDLHVDHVRLPSGKIGIREVVLHPGGVVVVPVLDNGRLVLVRQFRYPIKKYILEFPAGKLDSNQTPLATISRELEEEAGFCADSITHEFSFYATPGISNEIIHLFVARGLHASMQRLEDGEHITVETFTMDECLNMITSGEISDGKTLLGILWYNLCLHS